MPGRDKNIAMANARYKFCGKEQDAETGNDYFRKRYYDANTARWMTVDPLTRKYPN